MDNKQLETDNFNANMNLEHLQIEIERLKAESEKHSDECLSCYAKGLNEGGAEAVKKFAESLFAIKSTTTLRIRFFRRNQRQN